ncbi:MAG: SUF system NifU family Fe-S cluster assembly protein [Acidobacteria bacterium]|nr:MAG: SUF system NifU family Fe-S cluster assembly protein [Acidobacteriota bacterium]
MSDLRELYQEVILDHYRKPRNFTVLRDATGEGVGHNPLCGDRVRVWVKIGDEGVIEDVAFQGEGCAISTASASLMTEAVKGKTVDEAEDLFARFQSMLTGDDGEHPDLGKLEALAGVREYPIRVKCATLAWHTLHAALARRAADAGTGGVVSTEMS